MADLPRRDLFSRVHRLTRRAPTASLRRTELSIPRCHARDKAITIVGRARRHFGARDIVGCAPRPQPRHQQIVRQSA